MGRIGPIFHRALLGNQLSAHLSRLIKMANDSSTKLINLTQCV